MHKRNLHVIYSILLTFFIYLTSVSSVHATPPAITGIGISNNAYHNEFFMDTNYLAGTVTINWTTNDLATSQVNYTGGPQNINKSSYFDPILKRKHSVRIQNQLQRDVTYSFTVTSRNAEGEQTTSPAQNITIPRSSNWWEVGHSNWYKRGYNAWSSDTKWIAGSRNGSPYSANVYRKNVTLDSSVDGGWIQISKHHQGGSGYKLFVNGQLAGSWPYGFSAQSFDISSFLQNGDNVIVISQESGDFEFVSEGEIRLTDGSIIQLNSKPSTPSDSQRWRSALNPTGSWTQEEYDDNTSEWSDTLTTYQHAFDGPYVTRLVSGLPRGTSLANAQSSYASLLARRDELKESKIPYLSEDRKYFSIDDAYYDLYMSISSDVDESLRDFELDIELAKQFLILNDVSSAQQMLNSLESDMADFEMKIDTVTLLYDVKTDLISLELANQVINNSQIGNDLSDYGGELGIAFNEATNANYSSAKSRLETLKNQLSASKVTLENSGYKISNLNKSSDNALGWLRLRNNSGSPMYGNQFRRLAGRNVLGVKRDDDIGNAPSNIQNEFRSSLNFLTPFMGINVDASNYSLNLNISNASYSLANGIQNRPSTGSIYSNSTDGSWNKNWLFVWNSAGSNSPKLIIFEKNPQSITYSGGSLLITNPAGVGKIVVYDMFADNASLTSNSQNISTWSTSLPANVLSDIETFSRVMKKLPLNYVELYREVAGRSELTVKFKYFEINDVWNTQPITISPLSHLASLARQIGYQDNGQGVNVQGTVQDSNFITTYGQSNFGDFEYVIGDSLNFSYPKFKDNEYSYGVNIEGIDNSSIDKAEELGFNTIRVFIGRYILQGSYPQNEQNSFSFVSDWQTRVNDVVDYANSKGLKVILVVWSTTGEEDVGALDSSNWNAFVNNWGQMASILSGKNVVYDLINEPVFTTASTYNQLMQDAVDAIRVSDNQNPITIEGRTNFSREFGGMVRPNDSNIWFQNHAYPEGYSQVYSTLDYYYPGHIMNWYENGYKDEDTYFETFWLNLITRKLNDPNLSLFSGEFGSQMGAGDTKLNQITDMANVFRRYGIHHTYFTMNGWTLFDLYGGSGDTYNVDQNAVNALIGNEVQISPTSEPEIPGDTNEDGSVDGVDYVIWLNHYNQSTTPNNYSVGNFNNDTIVDGLDYVIWLNNYSG